MAVQKAVRMTGTGATVEEAVEECLDRAESTLEGITTFEVGRISGVREETGVVYRVEITVWFTLLERMHG
jgi:flavin-binding protein dodecin